MSSGFFRSSVRGASFSFPPAFESVRGLGDAFTFCSSPLWLTVQPGNPSACVVKYQYDRVSTFGLGADFVGHPLTICYCGRDRRMLHSVTIPARQPSTTLAE
jgi:hypothetical protein